jgi:hypothetical protein
VVIKGLQSQWKAKAGPRILSASAAYAQLIPQKHPADSAGSARVMIRMITDFVAGERPAIGTPALVR